MNANSKKQQANLFKAGQFAVKVILDGQGIISKANIRAFRFTFRGERYDVRVTVERED